MKSSQIIWQNKRNFLGCAVPTICTHQPASVIPAPHRRSRGAGRNLYQMRTGTYQTVIHNQWIRTQVAQDRGICLLPDRRGLSNVPLYTKVINWFCWSSIVLRGVFKHWINSALRKSALLITEQECDGPLWKFLVRATNGVYWTQQSANQ